MLLNSRQTTDNNDDTTRPKTRFAKHSVWIVEESVLSKKCPVSMSVRMCECSGDWGEVCSMCAVLWCMVCALVGEGWTGQLEICKGMQT